MAAPYDPNLRGIQSFRLEGERGFRSRYNVRNVLRPDAPGKRLQSGRTKACKARVQDEPRHKKKRQTAYI